MKKIYALLLLIACAPKLQAQTRSTADILERIRSHTAQLGPAFAPRPAMKGTAAMERVSAEADYSDNGIGTMVLMDSARFIYSGYRHSRFDFNSFRYINLSALGYGTTTDFVSLVPTPNNFDSGNLHLVAFDTLHHFTSDTLTGLPVRSHTLVAAYNADTSLSSLLTRRPTSSGSDSDALRQIILYDGSGRLSKVYALQANGAGNDTTAVRTISYNAAGQVTRDSVEHDPGKINQSTVWNYYSYNASGQYTSRTQIMFNGFSGSFDTMSRTTNTYYPNRQLRASTYEYNNGISLQRAYKDSLLYTPGVPGYTRLYETVYGPTGNVLYVYLVNTDRINARQLKDSMTIIQRVAGNDAVVGTLSMSYNASGDPVTMTTYSLTTGTPVLASENRWYYEVYPYTGAGVKPVQAPFTVGIYPNPTKGIIILDPALLASGTPVTVRIANTAGQLVHAERLVLRGSQQEILLGSEAAPGLYMVTVQDERGGTLYSGTLEKR